MSVPTLPTYYEAEKENIKNALKSEKECKKLNL